MSGLATFREIVVTAVAQGLAECKRADGHDCGFAVAVLATTSSERKSKTGKEAEQQKG